MNTLQSSQVSCRWLPAHLAHSCLTFANWLFFIFPLCPQVLCYTSLICPDPHRPALLRPPLPTRLNPAAAHNHLTNPTAQTHRRRTEQATWTAIVGWNQTATEATRTSERRRKRHAPYSHVARYSNWRQRSTWNVTSQAQSGLDWPRLYTSQKLKSRFGFRTEGTNGNARSPLNLKLPTWRTLLMPRFRLKLRLPKGWFESLSCTMRTSPLDPYKGSLIPRCYLATKFFINFPSTTPNPSNTLHHPLGTRLRVL